LQKHSGYVVDLHATDRQGALQGRGFGLDCAVFYVPANTVQVIWETGFTGQKTQPTVSKYWRKSQGRGKCKTTNILSTSYNVEKDQHQGV